MENFGSCVSLWGLILNLFNESNCSIYYMAEIPVGGFTMLEYLKYFSLTNALEWPFYIVILFSITELKQNFKKSLIQVLILNLSSHPFVFFIWARILSYYQFNYVQYLVTAEIIAPLIEMMILTLVFKHSWKKAFWASIIANVASWSIGSYIV